VRDISETGDDMSNINNSRVEDDDRFFLEEQELWENLGFDWEGWNESVEKVLKLQAAMKPKKQE
jgi:hypothetical protein